MKQKCASTIRERDKSIFNWLTLLLFQLYSELALPQWFFNTRFNVHARESMATLDHKVVSRCLTVNFFEMLTSLDFNGWNWDFSCYSMSSMLMRNLSENSVKLSENILGHAFYVKFKIFRTHLTFYWDQRCVGLDFRPPISCVQLLPTPWTLNN